MPEASSPVADRLLVIIPAFNESASIAAVVADVAAQVPGADIVVVDDGSPDDTWRFVPAPAKVIRLPFNLGIGGAMQTGYRYAHEHGYDLAVQIDGDGQHPADQVPRLVDAMRARGADMVIGSRFVAGGDDEYAQTMARMTGIRILNGLIRVLGGPRITDCTSGMRLVNRPLIDAFCRFYPEDYPEPEVALLAARAGYQVVEHPARMKQRAAGQTSIPLFRGLFYVLKVSVALLLDTMRDPWPHR